MIPTSVTFGKVQSLGDHLRADENIDLADAEIAEDAAVIVLALQRVGIHPRDARVRETVLPAFLQLFRCRGRNSESPGCGTSVRDKPSALAFRGRRCGSEFLSRRDDT